MRNNISALIVYNTNENITDEIKYSFGITGEAEKFDITHIKTIDKVFTALNMHRGIDCIVTIGDIDVSILSNSSFEFRKKWVHLDEYDKDSIANAIMGTLKLNIGRDRGGNKLFSIFTAAYKTPKAVVERLYNSLCRQTYKNWNWWIIDDTPNAYGENYYERLRDPRITVIRNSSVHGNIGFNKHMIAMCCDGDYLVEVDHDDELTDNCLEMLCKAFDTYKDADFVYSHAMEEQDGVPVNYGEYFALGLGDYGEYDINGEKLRIAKTPDVNALSLRHIVGLPNHVRCWRKEFYHKIGGHNTDLSVLDDMDILIRTALNGKMCKVDKVLYIQHEGSSNDASGRGSTTQGKRMSEILRLGVLLRQRYDEEIHNYFVNNGYGDPYWVTEENGDGYSDIWSGVKEGTVNLNYVL